jgi:hypothetical protein
MNEQVTTLDQGNIESTRSQLSVRRARNPPKNDQGQIYCDHTDCQATPPTFRRLVNGSKSFQLQF